MSDTTSVLGYDYGGISWHFEPGTVGRLYIDHGLFAHSCEFLFKDGRHILGVVVLDHGCSGELVDAAFLIDGRLEATCATCSEFSYRYFDYRAFPRDIHIDHISGWSL